MHELRDVFTGVALLTIIAFLIGGGLALILFSSIAEIRIAEVGNDAWVFWYFSLGSGAVVISLQYLLGVSAQVIQQLLTKEKKNYQGREG
ncbi:MAG: hypothetical protein JRN21_09860 [Nitrososphaerota archaeon]|nr:hypothetical protein [Nitrososphaerota archaeon]